MMRIYMVVLLLCALFLYGQKPISKSSVNLSKSLIASYLWDFLNRLSLNSNIDNSVVSYFGFTPHANFIKINDSEQFAEIIKDQIIIEQL